MSMLSEIRRRRAEEELDAELPLALRTFGMLLEMKVPFPEALRMAAREGRAAEFLGSVAGEIDMGASVPKALANAGKRVRSGTVKKAVAQLITAHEHGGGGEDVRRIAEDLLSLQRYRMRDYVSKSALFGLIFVIFAAVVPTFFLVFATAGKFALGIEVGGALFAGAFLLGFPLANAAILAASSLQMPPSAFAARTDWRKEAVFLIAALGLAGGMMVPLALPLKMGALVLASGIAWLAFGRGHWEETRAERLDAGLADALLGASGLPKSYGLDRIFERMGDGGGEFAAEARRTASQLKANVSPEKALGDLAERGRSFMVKRMCGLMLSAHLAGANISERMHAMAEDVLALGELRRERENALSMQKYTLLLASLVVPVILTVSFSLVSQISEFAGGGVDAEVMGLAPNAITAYIIAYSAISALYIANAEGRFSRAVPYFAAMALAGLVAFYILSQQFA